jgi:hypothetical protein
MFWLSDAFWSSKVEVNHSKFVVLGAREPNLIALSGKYGQQKRGIFGLAAKSCILPHHDNTRRGFVWIKPYGIE